ncbi:TPA: non-homologous end-joining DNA ligase [Legionella pneumophila]|nr:DNA ligase [Legionella pneumophila]HAT9729485.1 DNA ligase [Legionella pneumophila subsp. pneumophila]HAU0841546.1 DNA ligase [Legionella pneumophila]
MMIEKVEITHPDKMVFSGAQISKREVAEYYSRIANFILPWVNGRPVTLKCYPNGVNKEGFFIKHAPDYFSDSIHRVSIPLKKIDAHIEMLIIDKAEDLVYLAEQNTIELHIPLAKITDAKKPDQIVLDLDPSDDDFEKVRYTALLLKEILDLLQLPAFIKTTGSRSVHIHIPIKPYYSFLEIKAITKQIAERLHQQSTDTTTLEQRKNKRGNKVFIDYLRNDYGMTAVAPYSLRALENAPIATPIDWSELQDKTLGPRSYHLKNIFRRLAQKQDPWTNFVQNSIAIQYWDIWGDIF